MSKLKTLSKTSRRNYLTYGVVILAYIILQALNGSLSSSLKGMLVPICAYVVMAVSLNLTVGVLGELSLGHAGFMSMGAFTGTAAAMALQDSISSVPLRLAVAMVIGAVFAAIAGVLIGIPVLRLNGDYLAIVTLAFGEIIKSIFNNFYLGVDADGLHASLLSDTTDLGESGKLIIAGPMGIGSITKISSFTAGFILVIVTLIVVFNLANSRAGRAIMAIRDNRIAAESVGINIAKYKLIAIVTSAFFAGIAGALYSHNLSTLKATTNNFGYNMSIMILVFVVLGGMGSIRGSMIAAVVLYCLPECLRSMKDFRMLIYAIVLIGMMLMSSNEKIMNAKTRLTESVRGLLSFGRKNRKGGAE